MVSRRCGCDVSGCHVWKRNIRPDSIVVTASGFIDRLCDCDPINDTFECDYISSASTETYCYDDFIYRVLVLGDWVNYCLVRLWHQLTIPNWLLQVWLLPGVKLTYPGGPCPYSSPNDSLTQLVPFEPAEVYEMTTPAPTTSTRPCDYAEDVLIRVET